MRRAYNGNSRKCASIMHWNLGSRFWDKKRDDIQLLVDQYKPDYLFISEANLFHDTPEHLIEVEGYNLVQAKTMSLYKFSRIVLLCREGTQYSVELNRMEEQVSSIWITLGGKGRKSLLVGGGCIGIIA